MWLFRCYIEQSRLLTVAHGLGEDEQKLASRKGAQELTVLLHSKTSYSTVGWMDGFHQLGCELSDKQWAFWKIRLASLPLILSSRRFRPCSAHELLDGAWPPPWPADRPARRCKRSWRHPHAATLPCACLRIPRGMCGEACFAGCLCCWEIRFLRQTHCLLIGCGCLQILYAISMAGGKLQSGSQRGHTGGRSTPRALCLVCY